VFVFVVKHGEFLEGGEVVEKSSPCCNAKIEAALADGVLVGSCSNCRENVCRMNPKTAELEWLDGASPWIPEKLRPMGVGE
jgi:SH3-like domain-containing protein